MVVHYQNTKYLVGDETDVLNKDPDPSKMEELKMIKVNQFLGNMKKAIGEDDKEKNENIKREREKERKRTKGGRRRREGVSAAGQKMEKSDLEKGALDTVTVSADQIKEDKKEAQGKKGEGNCNVSQNVIDPLEPVDLEQARVEQELKKREDFKKTVQKERLAKIIAMEDEMEVGKLSREERRVRELMIKFKPPPLDLTGGVASNMIIVLDKGRIRFDKRPAEFDTDIDQWVVEKN